MKQKNVFILTFGCRLNQADSALILAKLKKKGFGAIGKDTKKQKKIIVINTCSVTASAAQKGRQAASSARKKNPKALIAVTGCDAEVNFSSWKQNKSVNIVIPGSQKYFISDYISNNNFIPSIAAAKNDGESFSEGDTFAVFPFRNRALIKIQEGCDSFCSFCIVPMARGKPRSRKLNEILEEAKNLIAAGHNELVLTGVNICLYQDEKTRLAGLVEKILSLEGDFRLRLSSTELDHELDSILPIMEGNSKLCRFLHIPLQHGTDEILAKMKRKHLTEDFAKFAEKAREMINGIHIGTDIICGLPGETDALFQKSCEFVEKMALSNIHIFRYSPREGTEAAKFADHPHPAIVKKRMKILEEIKRRSSDKFLCSQIGNTATFIGEKKESGNLTSGWSDNYIKTYLKEKNAIGKLIKIKFTAKENSLLFAIQTFYCKI